MYLEHINITVPSIDNAIHFLGTAFPEFYKRGEGQRKNLNWVHFGNQHTYFSLYEYVDDTRMPENTILNHTGLVVEELTQIRSRLEQAGYPLSEDANSSPFRQRHYYHDKNNQEWEFIQYLSDDPNERNHYE